MMKLIRLLILASGCFALSNSLFAQMTIENNDAYNAIVNSESTSRSKADVLTQYFGANDRIMIPNTDQSIGLLDLSMRAKNEAYALNLLDSGADISRYSKDLPPLISVSIEQRMDKVTSWILENHPESLQGIALGDLPLAYPIRDGNAELLTHFLRVLGDELPRHQEQIDNLLVLAISLGDLWAEVSEILIKFGADFGKNPDLTLAAAIKGQSEKYVKEALLLGANPNAEVYGVSMSALAKESLEEKRTPAAKANLKQLFQAGAIE